ncbi:MAG: ATP-binding protein [Thermodesulfobacteriota bacterium]|nr:ATP-binding protein [Thermodesulfobacteriota bacterium]
MKILIVDDDPITCELLVSMLESMGQEGMSVNDAKAALALIEKEGLIRITTNHENGRVTVTIADNDPGFSPDVLEKIWDPFFTSKPIGKGTGLGLAITSGIIESHDGTIEAENAPGGGARFVITLPIE